MSVALRGSSLGQRRGAAAAALIGALIAASVAASPAGAASRRPDDSGNVVYRADAGELNRLAVT
jgi:hypothetical protein